jgi:hypothetical protein
MLSSGSRVGPYEVISTWRARGPDAAPALESGPSPHEGGRLKTRSVPGARRTSLQRLCVLKAQPPWRGRPVIRLWPAKRRTPADGRRRQERATTEVGG